MNPQISNRYRGYTMDPLHPLLATVKRHKETEFCPKEKQILIDRILFDYMDETVDVRCDQTLPGLAIIAGHIDIGRPIGALVVLKDHVGRGRVKF